MPVPFPRFQFPGWITCTLDSPFLCLYGIKKAAEMQSAILHELRCPFLFDSPVLILLIRFILTYLTIYFIILVLCADLVRAVCAVRILYFPKSLTVPPLFTIIEWLFILLPLRSAFPRSGRTGTLLFHREILNQRVKGGFP